MAITNTAVFQTYNGNGSTQNFAIPFTFFDAVQVAVYLILSDGTETLQTNGVDYSITGTSPGTTVAMVTAPASGQQLRVERSSSFTQEVDFLNNTTVDLEAIERALDRLTMYAQENKAVDVSLGAILAAQEAAETAETNAETAQTAAEVAATAAEAAQAVAEAAQTAAELAETNAETAETNAETAETNAEAAQAAAEAAQAAAELAETNAETAETNAAASAAAALISENNASASAAAAQLAETNAETAETNAEAAQAAAEAAAALLVGLTANRALQTGTTGAIEVSSVTKTELGYLSGVTAPTGSGALVLGTSPALTTPDIGAAKGASLVVAASSPTLNASAILQADSTTKGFLPPRMTQAQRDAISTPATGLSVFNTDTNKLNVYNGSAWGEVGSGSSGINYITDTDGSVLGSWVTYADAAATSPVDGTGGSPTVTFATSSSSAMRGTSNFLFTHAASNQQGQGFSYTMAIDPSDRGKVLQLSFEYLVASGTYADNDLSIWFYDVTNSALIQPAPYLIKNSGIIEKFASEVQIPSSCASLRLIVHVATSTATAYTMRFENWSFGPQAKLYGSPVTDWGPVTTGSDTSNNSVVTYQWRKVGDTMEIDYYVTFSGTGDGGTYAINLPSGYSIDSSKLLDSTIGYFKWFDNGTSHKVGTVNYGNTTQIVLLNDGASAALDGSAFANGDIISANVRVPITGWSSSVVMSSDAATNVVAAKMTSSDTPTFASAALTKITWTAIETDSNGMADIANDRMNVLVAGDYDISAAYFFNSIASTNNGSIQLYARVNNTTNYLLAATGEGSGITRYRGINGSTIIRNLKAGDYVELMILQDIVATLTALNSLNHFTIKRISGPAQIAASDPVASNRRHSAGQTIPNNINTPVNFDVLGVDTHGSYQAGVTYNSGTGTWATNPQWNIQSSGLYEISANLQSASVAWTAGNLFIVGITRNGTAIAANYQVAPASATYNLISAPAIWIGRLNAGDYIQVYNNQQRGSATNLSTDSNLNWVNIKRIGI